MPVLGQPTKYHKKFKFIVEIDGFGRADFQDCSELSVEVAEIQQWEGGRSIPEKDPGRLTVTDLTLQRGATSDRDMYDWFFQVSRMSDNAGLVTPDFKRNLDIVQLDNDGSELRRWRCYRAWPKKFMAGDSWDNTADENVIEAVVLALDFFELVQAA